MSLLRSTFSVVINALFVSTCIAGIEARTGQRIKTGAIENESIRKGLEYTLGWGNTILVESGKFMSKYPDYFESNNKINIKIYF